MHTYSYIIISPRYIRDKSASERKDDREIKWKDASFRPLRWTEAEPNWSNGCPINFSSLLYMCWAQFGTFFTYQGCTWWCVTASYRKFVYMWSVLVQISKLSEWSIPTTWELTGELYLCPDSQHLWGSPSYVTHFVERPTQNIVDISKNMLPEFRTLLS